MAVPRQSLSCVFTGIVLAGAAACGARALRASEPGGEPLQNRSSEDPDDDLPQCPIAAWPRPAPPPGMILPCVGTPRQVHEWGGSQRPVWEAHYRVDEDDPAIQQRLAGRTSEQLGGIGYIGLEFYQRQLEAAGIEILGDKLFEFTYELRDAHLAVHALANGAIDPDPDDFVVLASRTRR
jgi:hypothetical protein